MATIEQDGKTYKVSWRPLWVKVVEGNNIYVINVDGTKRIITPEVVRYVKDMITYCPEILGRGYQYDTGYTNKNKYCLTIEICRNLD